MGTILLITGIVSVFSMGAILFLWFLGLILSFFKIKIFASSLTHKIMPIFIKTLQIGMVSFALSTLLIFILSQGF
ncbi:MAG: hypothetical protein CML28_01670 [Rhizobiales bacterium]|nr:hypothetical protein [Hyphomicrobiales bacterium]